MLPAPSRLVIAAAAAIGVAGYLGINPPGFVAQVVAFAFGLAAASLFSAILMGIFSKLTNKEGAITGMVVGLGFTFAYIAYFKGSRPRTPQSEVRPNFYSQSGTKR